MYSKLINHMPVKMLITVVERGTGEKITNIYKKNHIVVNIISFGMGTAKSDIMAMLGLENLEKDIVISMVPQGLIKPAFEDLERELEFTKPGKGIAFSLPLSGISAAASHDAEEEVEIIKFSIEKEVIKVENARKQDLIVSVVNHGNSDVVVEAAKEAGARGGTVVRGRAVASDEVEKFLGITIQPEKDIVMIIVPHEQKNKVMLAICNRILSETGEKGRAFSIPVDDMLGIKLGD